MAKILVQNIWRHHKPVAESLKFGCVPNSVAYIRLHEYLIQGAHPLDPQVMAETQKQMGYLCQFTIDLDPKNGKIVIDDDGQGLHYIPDKGFIGVDFLSYRIINSMKQSSEPKCITFYVDSRWKKTTPIVETIVKLDTLILHNGNSDKFNVDINHIDEEVERMVYGYNLLPDAEYLLYIGGSWGWHEHWSSNGYFYSRSLAYAKSVYYPVLEVKTSADCEIEVIKFNKKIDMWEGMKIPPYVWPWVRTEWFYFLDLFLALSPVSITWHKAKPSNKLPLVFYDRDDLTSKNRPIPEDNPTISNELLSKIVKRTLDDVPLLDDSRIKPIVLVNGRDQVILKKPEFTRYFNLDTTRIGKDLGVASYPVYSIKCLSPNHHTFLSTVKYPDTVAPDPVIPESPPSIDPLVDQGPNLPPPVILDPNTTYYDADIFRAVLTITNIPAGDNLAVVAHVLSSSAVVKTPGYTHRYLGKDSAGYFEDTQFSGFVIIDRFTCQYPVTDGKTLTLCKEYKFTANLEYLTTSNDVNGLNFCIPLDLTYLMGFVVVPCRDFPNLNALTSNYVPVQQNSESSDFPPVAASIYNQVYVGDLNNHVYPKINLFPEQQFYTRSTVLDPSIILYQARTNNEAFTVTFDLFDLTDLDPASLTTEALLYRVKRPEWGVNLNTALLYQDPQNVKICLENHFDVVENMSESTEDKWLEVVSIRAPAPIELKPTVSFRYAVILKYQKNTSTDANRAITVKMLDCYFNSLIYQKKILFDTEDAEQNLLIGYIKYTPGSPCLFVENLNLF